MDRYANKKSTARLRFLRPDGTPAANEAVQFSQTGHEFLFGCGAFDAVELMKDNLPAEVRTLLSEPLPARRKRPHHHPLPDESRKVAGRKGLRRKGPSPVLAHCLRQLAHELLQRGNPQEAD